MKKLNLLDRENVDEELAGHAELDEVTPIEPHAAMNDRKSDLRLKRHAAAEHLRDEAIHVRGARQSATETPEDQLAAADHEPDRLLCLCRLVEP
jgi:hypothetical protein